MTRYLFSLLLPFTLWSTSHFACPKVELPGKVIKEWRVENMPQQIKTVVIDAGHGGKDPGCLGANSQEKHIALAIAQKLAARIRAAHPDIRVILTRDRDVFIPLHERAAIANRNDADLFISIHCNFMPGSAATQGTETYVMGLHTAEYNLQVAKRENEAILLEDNYAENYDYDPNSPEGHILLSMFQNAFMEQSILFAESVEERIAVHAQRRSRGVKQAGFVVLKATSMPSVLIETGYLSNAAEEVFLSSAIGQDKISEGVALAFTEYRMALERELPLAARPPASSTVPAGYAIPAQSASGSNTPAGASYAEARRTTEWENIPAASGAGSPKPGSGIRFYVQLTASSQPPVGQEAKWAKVPFPIEVVQEDKLYKSRAYNFSSYEEALLARDKIRKLGFPDAFLTVYENGLRISAAEVEKKRKP